MLKLFRRRFYILMFLVWLVAVGIIFIFTIWGDMSSFVAECELFWAKEKVVVLQDVDKVEKILHIKDEARVPSAEEISKNINIVTAPSGVKIISNPRYTSTKDKFTVVLSVPVKVEHLTHFKTKKEHCLVVDIHGEWENKTANIDRFKDGLVRSVQYGMHPKWIRLVFYPHGNKDILNITPVLESTGNQLTITVMRSAVAIDAFTVKK
ncbi:MAG: AMIN domain-containing protein [Desulfotalea sp.]